MIWRILYFILPTCIFMALNIVGNRFVSAFRNQELKLFLTVLVGAIILIILFFLIKLLAKQSKMRIPVVGKFRFVAIGLIAGFILSMTSGYLFALTHQTSIDWVAFKHSLYPHVIKQIPHALTEEIDFRFGIVGGALGLWGENAALLAGSVPFGVLHAVDLFFGVPVNLSQVIGVCLAGLLLTVLYLRFGLWAAVGLHYIWNWLAPAWVHALGLPLNSGINDFEGAWTMSLMILIILSSLKIFNLLEIYIPRHTDGKHRE